jgi:hypothetical protein
MRLHPMNTMNLLLPRCARLLMGSAGGPCLDGQGGVYHWSWREEDCAAVFQPPDQWDWLSRLSALEPQGLVGLCAYAGIYGDAWLDEATEENFERYVTGAGVVALAQ